MSTNCHDCARPAGDKPLELEPRRYPEVCSGCRHLDSDYNEWHDVTSYYCKRNVFMPTKKNTCKVREPYERT
mgnify:CR=1 FL=1